MLLNCERPYSEESAALAKNLENEYQVSVMPVNCEQLKKEDVTRILEKVLKEFPVTELDFYIPKWLELLPSSHWLKEALVQKARDLIQKHGYMKEITSQMQPLAAGEETIGSLRLRQMNLADGSVAMDVQVDDGYYYQTLSDYVGLPIAGEYELMQTLSSLAHMQKEYQKVEDAMNQVRLKGYGVVTPEREEILLDEPQVVRHGNKYGVKIKAQAPSINLIQAHIETEIAPIVGSEQQARDLIDYIKKCSQEEDGIWETNIFGKSVEQIVEDGIQAKISQLTEECQMKLQDTLQKIINDSNGGMICIII